MNENLDLTKILKDCPSGTELYSSICGTVVFERVCKENYYPIITNKGDFTADGKFHKDGECVLFPSKDQRDWSKWKRLFVSGDVVATKGGEQVFILSKITDPYKGSCFIGYDFKNNCVFEQFTWYFDRHATEEEKQKLFNALKENGYKWDVEKKELKKIEPKFDISTLQPFDRVLARDMIGEDWHIELFGCYIERKHNRFRCLISAWEQCVPYNDETKHLLGTTQQAPDKYITWE